MSNYAVLCLGDHPELLEKCAKLLNTQWPRSLNSRLRSLEQSNNSPGSFPTSLLLVQKSHDNKLEPSVIGHSKILPVPQSNNACFVESVVIEHTLRKKGLGRIIMEETENFVRKKGIKEVHLTTHDQQGFYEKVGYQLSEPIVVYGGISSNLQKFMETQNFNQQTNPCPKQEKNQLNFVTTSQSIPTISSPSPPPPPPPPVVNMNNNLLSSKVYMVKYLE